LNRGVLFQSRAFKTRFVFDLAELQSVDLEAILLCYYFRLSLGWWVGMWEEGWGQILIIIQS